jgi:hypothetical protein
MFSKAELPLKSSAIRTLLNWTRFSQGTISSQYVHYNAHGMKQDNIVSLHSHILLELASEVRTVTSWWRSFFNPSMHSSL